MGRKQAKLRFVKRYTKKRVAFAYLCASVDRDTMDKRADDLRQHAHPKISEGVDNLVMQALMMQTYDRLLMLEPKWNFTGTHLIQVK